MAQGETRPGIGPGARGMAPRRPRGRRRALVFGAGMLALFALGAVAAASATGWAETAAALGRVGPGDVALLLALSMTNYLARAARWRLFGRAIGAPTGLGADLLFYFGGFAMTATPGKLGELIRLWWIWRATGWSYDRTGAMAVGDRFGDLASVGVILALAAGAATGPVWLAAGLAAAALGVSVLAMRPAVARWAARSLWRVSGVGARVFVRLRRAADGLGALSAPAVAAPALALGALGWLSEGLALWALLQAMGAEVSWHAAVFIFCLSMLAGAASALPGGLGGTEAAMVALLSAEGVGLETAVAATAVIRATTLWFAVGLGVLALPLAQRAAGGGGRPA